MSLQNCVLSGFHDSLDLASMSSFEEKVICWSLTRSSPLRLLIVTVPIET